MHRARRPKVSTLVECSRLRVEVERGLKQRWSPQQITARSIRDYPGDPEMRVSHETIYQSPFVRGRGALRQELTRYLRSGRAYQIWDLAPVPLTLMVYAARRSKARGERYCRPECKRIVL